MWTEPNTNEVGEITALAQRSQVTFGLAVDSPSCQHGLWKETPLSSQEEAAPRSSDVMVSEVRALQAIGGLPSPPPSAQQFRVIHGTKSKL